jgi:uncharacterized protein (DUF433 family)
LASPRLELHLLSYLCSATMLHAASPAPLSAICASTWVPESAMHQSFGLGQETARASRGSGRHSKHGVQSAALKARIDKPPESREYSRTMTFTRISIRADQMGGIPCIRGLRIPVATVVDMVADGRPVTEILEAYPDLEADDVTEALRYAAEAVRERELPLAAAG